MKTIGKTKKAEAPVFDAEGYQVNLSTLDGTALPDLKRVVAQPLNHGGARHGAGRKPSGRKPILSSSPFFFSSPSPNIPSP